MELNIAVQGDRVENSCVIHQMVMNAVKRNEACKRTQSDGKFSLEVRV